MTNEKILKKAIEKAVRSGWDATKEWCVNARIDKDGDFRCSELEKEDTLNIIFSHGFAEIFWGSKPYRIKKVTGDYCISGKVTVKKDGGWELNLKEWQGHLQQMVLEKEPLKYLEKFL